MAEMMERLVKAGREAQAQPGAPDRVVRAVLAELREPDDATTWKMADALQGPIGGSAFDAARKANAVMIDAILAE